MLLEAGDAVSADCRLVEAHEVAVNNAALTGESDAVARVDAPVPAGPPLEARNFVFMGTDVVAGTGKAVVCATEFGRLPGGGSPAGRDHAAAGTVVATVVRDGRPTVPRPEVTLLPGDELLLVSHEATEQEIHAAFQ